MSVSYRAPVSELRFLLRDVFAIASLAEKADFADLDSNVIDAVLEGGSKLAAEVLAPLNRRGDEQGSRLVGGRVLTPSGFAAAYRRVVDDGWLGLDLPREFGGQGQPRVLQAALGEMIDGANLSFGMQIISQRAAARLLAAHGDAVLRSRYLPGLVRGDFGATIAITEAGAGSDVGRLTTQAVRETDGRYRLSGQKIFISYADQDFTEQILHMVLARVPGSAPGTRGLSVFLVPRVLDQDGAAAGNGISIERLEHKMGLKASPTCAVRFQESQGYLLGSEGRGMSAMFAMVNTMRLAVAVQGVAVAGAALRLATQYALERRQGGAADAPALPIVQHPDVMRLLLDMRARTEAQRALNLFACQQIDMGERAYNAAERATAAELGQLLLPICKACSAELGHAVAQQAIQVLGGHGYIAANGVEQLARDARVASIYEGTTGIQAIDLLQRKVLADEGKRWQLLLAQIRAEIAGAPAAYASQALAGLDQLTRCTAWLIERQSRNAFDVSFAATPFLRLAGVVLGAWAWCRMLVALRGDSGFAQNKRSAAQYYFEQILPEADMSAAQVMAGAASAKLVRLEQWAAL